MIRQSPTVLRSPKNFDVDPAENVPLGLLGKRFQKTSENESHGSSIAKIGSGSHRKSLPNFKVSTEKMIVASKKRFVLQKKLYLSQPYSRIMTIAQTMINGSSITVSQSNVAAAQTHVCHSAAPKRHAAGIRRIIHHAFAQPIIAGPR